MTGPGDTRVRVRGVAATAVTRFLLQKGFRIVQASRVIQERLGIPLDPAPADVTVKDAGRGELLVIGYPDKARLVYETLVDALAHVFTWRAPIGLYSIVKAVVTGLDGDTCILELPGGLTARLERCGRSPGEPILVSVVHPPVKSFEETRVSRVLRVIGDYVMVLHGTARVSVSEHVRDPDKRRELVAAAVAAVMGKGLGVHVRSSGNYASAEDVVSEINRLIEKLHGLLEEAGEAEAPSVIYEGEFIGLIGLTSTAKERLDKIRSSAAPTVRGHHMYKYFGGCLSDVVDYAEEAVAHGSPSTVLEAALRGHVTRQLVSRPMVKLIHVRPTGEIIELSPGKVIHVDENTVIVKRVIRGDGVYDGLGVEKRRGDTDYVFIYPGKWLVSHNYFRGETWLGSYININTPPEILPGEILYHDLEIDIIYKPGHKPEIIDKEKLEEQRGKTIPEKLYEKTIKEAEKALREIDKITTRQPPSHEQ